MVINAGEMPDPRSLLLLIEAMIIVMFFHAQRAGMCSPSERHLFQIKESNKTGKNKSKVTWGWAKGIFHGISLVQQNGSCRQWSPTNVLLSTGSRFVAILGHVTMLKLKH